MATDQQTGGLAQRLVIDRQTASRMGISPQMIDETLYDSFGQRQISTLYTQLNQYHVILETLPSFQRHPDDLHDIYVRSGMAATAPNSSASSSGVLTTSASPTVGPAGPSATSTSGFGEPRGGHRRERGSCSAERVHAHSNRNPRRSRSIIKANSRL